MAEYQFYQLNCQSLGVTIDCQLVTPMARLLGVMLSGWQLIQLNEPLAQPDLRVQFEDKYLVSAPEVEFYARHGDLVSGFNETLIALTYLTCVKAKDLVLFHGGAMIAGGQDAQESDCNQLFLGGHKAGKSTYLAKHCQVGGLLVSDDLLLVDAQGRLRGLGFPLRLRRPVDKALLSQLGAQQILAGHSLVYISPKAIKVLAAGVPLHIDEVYLLEDYCAQALPQEQWLPLIEQRVIPIPGESS